MSLLFGIIYNMNIRNGVAIMNICIYGASSNAIDKSYMVEVEEFSEKMAKRGHGLVFGAGASGLMGASARGVYKAGGYMVGVVPSFFNVDGTLFENCNELIRTETMRERKRILEERADAFVMVPGGIGTFDEFFEILTLKQLGRHSKAIVVYNINGYYDALLDMMKKSVDENFIYENVTTLYTVMTDTDEILDYLEGYKPKEIDPVFFKDVTRK